SSVNGILTSGPSGVSQFSCSRRFCSAWEIHLSSSASEAKNGSGDSINQVCISCLGGSQKLFASWPSSKVRLGISCRSSLTASPLPSVIGLETYKLPCKISSSPVVIVPYGLVVGSAP